MWKAFMPNSEASTWERLRRVGRFPPSFRPLLSMPSAVKLRLEEAVRLDRLASRSGQALGYAYPPDSILINALVLRNLANLRVDDNPEVGSSVLLIGVAWIQSNFEPMRKQVALFEL
jgi:hypothetical protein